MQNSFVGIIPARFASTRLPGKPLADLCGKTLIQRVYEQVSPALDDVFVATDDMRIAEAVSSFGGRYVITSDAHRSGTDRCREAYEKLGLNHNIIINIQGDEPFIQLEQLEALKACFTGADIQIATLAKPFLPEEDITSPNSPKVVINKLNEAMYFSRSAIPYFRGVPPAEWASLHIYYRHIGIYACRADVLHEITRLPQSPLELSESLEQLRWLEHGYKIKVGITTADSFGIDTPEDLEHARQRLSSAETILMKK
ncbi:MAG: 3-deoxy-manno-octulosonate cytidylyltransferase [Tannerellaceae bacterium]|jgi:3-deoxy-manno-octulosonate cytidylyltransferase (CMP-KDO synthetase)|nr:3-deoxy-manno-octulosonate cytidylyltransferase [Tannerellaceae bacterium]